METAKTFDKMETVRKMKQIVPERVILVHGSRLMVNGEGFLDEPSDRRSSA